MRTWTQTAVVLGVLGGLVALSLAYSARLGHEWLAQLEIDELERIPVLGEDR